MEVIEERNPEYVDKGEIDPGKVAEVYSLFGFSRTVEDSSLLSIDEVEEEYDSRNELIYLLETGRIEKGGDYIRIKEDEAEKAIEVYMLSDFMEHEDLAEEFGLVDEDLENYLEEECSPSSP